MQEAGKKDRHNLSESDRGPTVMTRRLGQSVSKTPAALVGLVTQHSFLLTSPGSSHKNPKIQKQNKLYTEDNNSYLNDI